MHGSRGPAPTACAPPSSRPELSPWPEFTDAGGELAIIPELAAAHAGFTAIHMRCRPCWARRRPCGLAAGHVLRRPSEFPWPPSHAAAGRSSPLVSSAVTFAPLTAILVEKHGGGWNEEGESGMRNGTVREASDRDRMLDPHSC